MTSVDNISFRKITHSEKKIVVEQIYDSFNLKSNSFFEDYEFWVKEGKIKQVFLLPKNISKLVIRLQKNAYFAGIPIGSIWNGKFQLEIEGGSLFLSTKTNIITVETEQFLYGKHIFAANIVSVEGNFQKYDWVNILGKNNLHYGVGKTLFSSDDILDLGPNTIVIRGYRNKPFDRGWYLRKGH